jgi:hypothetical protein
MSDDFPAAHSMDTTWFAVDGKGHVAFFRTGENGHAPHQAEDGFDLLERLWALRQGKPVDEELFGRELVPGAGVFFYDYADTFDPIGTYGRLVVPEVPLHVDQLPPELRTRVRTISFDTLDFSQAELIQPLEHMGCTCWYQDDRVAYYASDDVTIRPVRGMEHRFAAFVEQVRRDNPEQATQFRFEEPDQDRPAPG